MRLGRGSNVGGRGVRLGRGSNVVGRGGKRCRIHDSKNSHKSVTWSVVPVTPAFTLFLVEGKLGQRPQRGR